MQVLTSSSSSVHRSWTPSRPCCVHTMRQFLGLPTPSSTEVDCRRHKHQDSDTLQVAATYCLLRDLAHGYTKDFHQIVCSPCRALQSIPHLDHWCIFSYGLVLHSQLEPKTNISVNILALYRYVRTRVLLKLPITSLEQLSVHFQFWTKTKIDDQSVTNDVRDCTYTKFSVAWSI